MADITECSKGYRVATQGRNWKTAGDDVQYDIVVTKNTDFEDHKIIHVFYQCSMSKRDWQHNMDFLPMRVKFENHHIWVFRGLWKAFISAWPIIWQEIMNIMASDKNYIYQLHFAGHSFGGAMSIFSAIVWGRQQHNIDSKIPHSYSCELTTWGAPRALFGKKAREALSFVTGTNNYGILNYACYNDMIARMPPFYKKNPYTEYVGEKFNLFKMIKKAEYYHTCYGNLDK